MTLLYETSLLGFSIKVFSNHIEYKAGLGGAIEMIPIAQIAGVKVGSFLVNRLTIETTGGREYVVPTGKKKEIATAIYQAQAALRSGTPVAAAHGGSVADELAKLAKLRVDGVLTPEEFERQKHALLGGPSARSSISMAAVPLQSALAPRPSSSFGTKLKIAGIVVGGLFALMIVIGVAAGNKKDIGKPEAATTGSAVDPEHPLAHLFSEQEKKYFGVAGNYLAAVNMLDTKVAAAMVGTQSGKTTLDDIKAAVEATSTGEEAQFDVYRNAPVPDVFGSLDSKIRKCRSLHDSAFKELLRYWKDSNTSHIERGSDTLMQAVKLTNESIEDLKKTVDRLAAERRAVAATTSKPNTTIGPECRVPNAEGEGRTLSGECKNVSECGANHSYHAGFCQGPASVVCCVRSKSVALEMIGKYTESKDAMCRCKANDVACAKRVQEDMNKWTPEATKMDPKEAEALGKKITPIVNQLLKCMEIAVAKKPHQGSAYGIGAVLRKRDHYVEIVELIPGSAGSRSGKLGSGDLILSVQSEGRAPVNALDMKVDDVAAMIGGPKGTVVRIRVRKSAGNEETVEIKRDVIPPRAK